MNFHVYPFQRLPRDFKGSRQSACWQTQAFVDKPIALETSCIPNDNCRGQGLRRKQRSCLYGGAPINYSSLDCGRTGHSSSDAGRRTEAFKILATGHNLSGLLHLSKAMESAATAVCALSKSLTEVFRWCMIDLSLERHEEHGKFLFEIFQEILSAEYRGTSNEKELRFVIYRFPCSNAKFFHRLYLICGLLKVFFILNNFYHGIQ